MELVLARGREEGGPPGRAVGSAMSAVGGMSASMMEGRRACAAIRESRRSERKLGPGGEASPVRRQLRRGSWMNYTILASKQTYIEG